MDTTTPETTTPNPGFAPSMKILTPDQLSAIHTAALDLLEKTGVRITHPRGREIMENAGCTDAKEVDAQAAVEGSLQDLVMATVGGGLVHDTHCWLDHGAILSPAHLVMGQEILNMVKQFTRGIDVSEQTLALDLIDKIGPGGTFLMDPHTMQNFKTVIYPELFQRIKGLAPGERPAATFDERLREKTRELMAQEPVNPLSVEIVAEFDRRQKQWMDAL